MADKLFAAIAQYQEDVFEYRPSEMAASFLAIIDALDYWTGHVFQDEERAQLNKVLQIMLAAYESNDYLLVADLAEYELKTLAELALSRRSTHVAAN